METRNSLRYPISSQPFEEIREENYVYIDKTAAEALAQINEMGHAKFAAVIPTQ